MYLNDDHRRLIHACIEEGLYQLPHEYQDKVTIEHPEGKVVVRWSRAFKLEIQMDDTGDGVRVTGPFETRLAPFSDLAGTLMEMVVSIHAVLLSQED